MRIKQIDGRLDRKDCRWSSRNGFRRRRLTDRSEDMEKILIKTHRREKFIVLGGSRFSRSDVSRTFRCFDVPRFC